MDILDAIFPKNCFGCKKAGRYICASCLAKEEIRTQACPVCKRASIDGMTHTKCLKPRSLDGLASFWKYEGPIRRAILVMKYRFAFDIARQLGEILADGLTNGFNPLPGNALLVPIPVYKDRSNWRGFNQAGEMGKVVAEKINLKFVPDLLLKRKKTKPQTGLDRKRRLKNLRGAFVPNPHYSSLITHCPLVLLDDVWTTGSTLKESAKVLKGKGAKSVWGLTFARG